MILALYSLTTFLSALLLFSIQPAMGKLLIPSFGGTPAVWNSCVLFFQMVVFLGYLYANMLASKMAVRKQIALHLIVIAVPFILSNIFLSTDQVASDSYPVLSILYFLSVSVGTYVFALSATTPLLQHWFGCSKHSRSADPYFLYAASNLGSLLGLLCYPFLWESIWPLLVQLQQWHNGYFLFAALISCSMMYPLVQTKVIKPLASTPRDTAQELAPLNRDSRTLIIFGGFVAASYLLGVTTHAVTNVAAVPLLWIIPLALYLISFVVSFSRFGSDTYRIVGRYYLLCAVPMFLLMFSEIVALGSLQVLLHFSLFFLASLLCHAAVAQVRPPVGQLTEFYVLLSIGGLLGGVFNTILVPLIFPDTWEYPLILIASFALLPGKIWDKQKRLREELKIPLLIALVLTGTTILLACWPSAANRLLKDAIIGGCLVIAYSFRTELFRLLVTNIFILLAVWANHYLTDQTLVLAQRNFYGIKKVVDRSESNLRMLVHGNTDHGAESLDPSQKGNPLTYFHRNGPVGDVFKWMRSRSSRHPQPMNVAIVGLGVGAMVSYAESGDSWTLFELDPEIAEIASNVQYFSFLTEAKAPFVIVLGDGRKSLQKQSKLYDIIFLDAFSSDAVPTHLLTIEAIELYLNRLNEGGILVFNVSNRFLDIESVIYRAAQELKLHAISRIDHKIPKDAANIGRYPSQYVVVAKDKESLETLRAYPDWSPRTNHRKVRVWTDQYSAIGSLFY